MIRLRCGALVLAVLSAAMLFVAVAQATLSSHLRAATITVQNGSLPPPAGRAHVYR